jgi:dihydroorotate dehydrogenase
MNWPISQLTAYAYQKVVKPIFFCFDPEVIHHQNIDFGKLLGKSNLAQKLFTSSWAYAHPSLVKKIDGISFPNPVGLSAGFDYNGELTQILPAIGFGFHTIGTVTLHSYSGNIPPRLGRFPRSQALLVNKGLKNLGAKEIIKKLHKSPFHIPTGISIASTNMMFRSEKQQVTDIIDCFKLFEESSLKHAYYELNISCPNTFDGEPFTNPDRLEMLMKEMDNLKISRPMYIKMTIDQSEEETIALLKTLEKHNVQGIIIGNLTKDKKNSAVDPKDQIEWQKRKGNLSGKPTWERSNRLIQLARKTCKKRFTIIGTGGIFSGEDAQTKIDLGADLVQLITGMIYKGPQLIGQINHYLVTSNEVIVNNKETYV